MHANPRAFGTLLLAICLTGAAGCGEKHLPVYPVKGRVTYNGKPVTLGTVLFNPLDDKGPRATGALQPDGSYSLTTYQPDDGAIAGEHKIAVFASTPGEGVEGQPGYKEPKPLVPVKFFRLDLTPLRQTVQANQNTIDLNLTN